MQGKTSAPPGRLVLSCHWLSAYLPGAKSCTGDKDALRKRSGGEGTEEREERAGRRDNRQRRGGAEYRISKAASYVDNRWRGRFGVRHGVGSREHRRERLRHGSCQEMGRMERIHWKESSAIIEGST